MSYAVGDKVIIACPNHNEKSPLNGHTCIIKRILHKTNPTQYED